MTTTDTEPMVRRCAGHPACDNEVIAPDLHCEGCIEDGWHAQCDGCGRPWGADQCGMCANCHNVECLDCHPNCSPSEADDCPGCATGDAEVIA